MDIYDELMKRNDYDRSIHAFKACCMYALCNYKEAKAEVQKADDSELKNRLLFQLAQKCGDENEIMSYHGALSNSIEDQLCMAALHYLRSHFEEATEIYKKLLIENKDYHAINIYVALCYYKMDYYDVSLEILAVYLGLYPDSIVGVNLKATMVKLLRLNLKFFRTQAQLVMSSKTMICLDTTSLSSEVVKMHFRFCHLLSMSFPRPD
jgi:intraflagellar transport protein 56